MQTNLRRFARHIAAPLICAGVIAGAAIGLAGSAGASTDSTAAPAPNQIGAAPHTTAPKWLQPRHRVLLLPPEDQR